MIFPFQSGRKKTDIETIEHVLWECDCVQTFIEQIDDWFLQNGIAIPFTKQNFMFGNTQKVCKGDPKNIIFMFRISGGIPN